MIRIKNVSKQYGDFQALQAIDMELDTGLYGLLAPNGAGRTTLIKILATLVAPTEGEVLYNGRSIIELDEQYRNVLGYLPQQFGFYKNDSPKQYLHYLAALKGLRKKEASGMIDDLLEKVALGDVAGKKMKKFSGGMIQRVGIAQALLNNPKVLILDEPTAGLDPKERARFRQMLTEYARDRLVIVSTHIVSDIESIANEVIMIKNKQLLYKDSVNRICDTLAGAVYETFVPYEQMDGFRKRCFVLSERQEGAGMSIRFIHKGKAEPDWQPVMPQLEDVFLYEYRDTAALEA